MGHSQSFWTLNIKSHTRSCASTILSDGFLYFPFCSFGFALLLTYSFFLYISLRTTLCVRFKSEVIACGVVYAAARRRGIALPEDPPWWTVFDADEAGIQEVCRVLAHLYSLPKSEYIPVYKDNDSFTVRRTPEPQVSKVNT